MTPGGSDSAPTHRGDRSNDAPGRKTAPAYTRRRRIWYGMGKTGSDEKSAFGRFLHDVPYVYAEISVVSLPALWYVLLTVRNGGFGVMGSALVVWTAMTLVATVIHMGSIRPLATGTLGWVSLSPSLVGLRLVYYNLAVLVGSYGSVALAALIGYPPLSLGTAAVVGILSMITFPRLAETVARRRAR